MFFDSVLHLKNTHLMHTPPPKKKSTIRNSVTFRYSVVVKITSQPLYLIRRILYAHEVDREIILKMVSLLCFVRFN